MTATASPQLVGCSPISLALNAPLAGVAEWVLHAVDIEGLRFHSADWTARCGAEVHPALAEGAEARFPLRWPARWKSLAEGVTVCPDCRRPSERPRDQGPYRVFDAEEG